ncbi:MAG: FHA domain-containing protein, partial [Pseudomonadota bacterium]
APLLIPWGRLKQMTVAGVYRDIHYLYGSKFMVGREEGEKVFPDDEFMSRKHLVFSLVDGKAQVQDLGSSNGTFVRIRNQVFLNGGDMLRVGDQLLRFELG